MTSILSHFRKDNGCWVHARSGVRHSAQKGQQRGPEFQEEGLTRSVSVGERVKGCSGLTKTQTTHIVRTQERRGTKETRKSVSFMWSVKIKYYFRIQHSYFESCRRMRGWGAHTLLMSGAPRSTVPHPVDTWGCGGHEAWLDQVEMFCKYRNTQSFEDSMWKKMVVKYLINNFYIVCWDDIFDTVLTLLMYIVKINFTCFLKNWLLKNLKWPIPLTFVAMGQLLQLSYGATLWLRVM